MNSCIYEGTVAHHRSSPIEHSFRYRLFLLYLDLHELDTVFERRWLWSTNRPNLAWFRRADHLGDANIPLAECVRGLVEERTGSRPLGAIRLLTHLRYFGYGMNPVSFYYCFDAADRHVEYIVAEINNTPWREQHCYVVGPLRPGEPLQAQFDKDFHVSPFLSMEQRYFWSFSPPGNDLSVHMTNHEANQSLFLADMRLERRSISSRGLASVLVRFPLMTAKVIAAIYWQALRLRWKRCPFYPHPKHAMRTPS